MFKSYSLLTHERPSVEIIDPTVSVFSSLKSEIKNVKEIINRYHNKISVVNIARDYCISLSEKTEFQKNQFKYSIDKTLILEQYQIKINDTDIVLNIKTYAPTAIIGRGQIENNTIEQMNRSIEEAKTFFNTDLMLSIRNYCFSLITSATDHQFECWTIDNMFSFKFIVHSAKLEIDFLLIKQ